MSADNFSASCAGVPGGAMMANQVIDRKSGMISAIASTSGGCGMLRALPTSSG
jgi:hypothetical protein